MYTVKFKVWHNNWTEPIYTEEYDNLHDARCRAEIQSSFTVTGIGNNCYVNNGCQTWVTDDDGEIIFEGLCEYIAPPDEDTE